MNDRATNELVSLSIKELVGARALRQQQLLVSVEFRQEGNDGIVTIPHDAVVSTTGAGRRKLSAPNNSRWRWAAGGCFIVLRLNDARVGLMRLRDAGAPSFGGHYTLASGLSASARELLHPDELALREGCEEYAIATPDGIVIPSFGDPKLDAVTFGAAASVLDLIRQEPTLPPTFSSGRLVKRPASFLQSRNEGVLTASFHDDDDTVESRGIIVLDPNTRGIDLLRIVEVSIPVDFRHIAIFDGEDDRGKPLNGEVACLDLDSRGRSVAKAYRTGVEVTPSGDLGKMTPILKAAVREFN